jgi:hypothetical protein
VSKEVINSFFLVDVKVIVTFKEFLPALCIIIVYLKFERIIVKSEV